MAAITTERKREIAVKFGSSEADMGSTKVQIALLTERINHLRDHFDAHKKDHSSRRGLLKLVSRRNQLLKYLTRTDRTRYQQIIARLDTNQAGLRETVGLMGTALTDEQVNQLARMSSTVRPWSARRR